MAWKSLCSGYSASDPWCKYQVQLFPVPAGGETPAGLAFGKEEAQEEENKENQGHARNLLPKALQGDAGRERRPMESWPEALSSPKQVDGWKKP